MNFRRAGSAVGFCLSLLCLASSGNASRLVGCLYCSPSGLCVDASGNFAYASGPDGRFLVFAKVRRKLSQIASKWDFTNGIDGMAPGPSGILFILSANEVWRYDWRTGRSEEHTS